MNLESIAEKLELDGVGNRAFDIFINHLPTEAERAILLRDPYIGTPIDPELPNYRVTRFNVAARAKSYQEGKELMSQVMRSLTLSNTALTGMEVRYIRPRTEPIAFPMSQAGMFEFLVIFDAVYVIVQ